MIAKHDNLFALHGDGFSCLVQVNRYGLPELIHFGAPVHAEDAAALGPAVGTGWGSSVVLEDSDPASCADVMPLAWSGCGQGDYRESPLELEDEAGPMVPRFRYLGYAIAEGIIPMKGGLPQARGEEDCLTLTFEADGLRLKLCFTVMGGVLVRRTVLENTGDKPVYVRKCMSFCADLPGRFDMTNL